MRRTGPGEVRPTGSCGGSALGAVFVPSSSVRGNGVRSAICYLLPFGSSFPDHALRNSPTGLGLPCDPMEPPRGCQAHEEVWEEVWSLFDPLGEGFHREAEELALLTELPSPLDPAGSAPCPLARMHRQSRRPFSQHRLVHGGISPINRSRPVSDHRHGGGAGDPGTLQISDGRPPEIMRDAARHSCLLTGSQPRLTGQLQLLSYCLLESDENLPQAACSFFAHKDPINLGPPVVTERHGERACLLRDWGVAPKACPRREMVSE